MAGYHSRGKLKEPFLQEVIVIAQGGGPTAVINQTVAGATLEARKRNPKARVLGAKHGIRGCRKADFVDLSRLSESDLRRFAATPNSGLGSTRDKPDPEYCAGILEALRKVSAKTFIYVGGNDTADTMRLLDEAAGREIAFIHAPKTIDNDLVENDHTPGFISAAWFVAAAFLSADLDFRAMPGIYAGIVMGRHAGFLTASGAAWRRAEGDGPHLVYLPERGFSVQQLIADVAAVRDKHGRCIVAMSEGVHGEDGRPLLESLREQIERDAHGNVQLTGGDLGIAVQGALSEAFPKVRVRVDTFGYLPRAFPAMISDIDRREAFEVGVHAIAAAESGSASVALKYEDGKTVCRAVPLASIAGKTRLVPEAFIAPSGHDLSAEGRAYLDRLVPKRPEIFTSLI
jgi:6-phosphofructokinase